MIGIIGDLHLKENLGYADYVKDRRIPEAKEVLDFIVKSFSDCDSVVFMGDQLHSRSSSPHVIKEFVNFLERFEGKEVYVLAGNHEKFGDGRSAMDFLKEITNKRWTIVTNAVFVKNDMVLCPYFTKAELETTDNKKATEKIMKMLSPNNILFTHHAISDTLSAAGIDTNIFPEPVLPKTKLEKIYKMVIAGHIHTPQAKGRTIITGSIFTSQIGDIQKYIWKLDEKTLKVEQIKLPCREIHQVKDPKDEELAKIKKNSIVKAIITKKLSAPKLGELKDKLKKFDAFLLLEQVPHERKKLHFGEGESLLEFDVDKLLEVYAKEKQVDINKLRHGFELIR